MSDKLIEDLDILGKPYQVVLVDPTFEEGTYGQCDDANGTLKIRRGQKDLLELDTVLHEMTHAIDFAMALRLKERQVAAYAAGLVCVLKANPHLLDYIWEKLNAESDDGN